jgi:anti-sigma regulatory factor (Ser/Thr protein kinase)
MFLESGGGKPLGIDGNADFPWRIADIGEGFGLLMYTDGVTEAANAGSELFGEDRLIERIEELKGLSAGAIVGGVLSSVEAHAAGREPADDIAILAFVRAGTGTKLRLSGERDVRMLADEIAKWASRVRLERTALDDITLAAEEMVVNAARYAFKDSKRSDIDISANISDGVVRIEISYGGIAFDPTSHSVPDTTLPLSERRPGGLGIFLAKETMDEMRYERRGELNVVTLTKRVGEK